MWTVELIAQAVGWTILIAGFPLIFIYIRKITLHFSYVLFPRDMLIQYRSKSNEVESFILKQSFFSGKTLTRVSSEKAKSLGGEL